MNASDAASDDFGTSSSVWDVDNETRDPVENSEGPACDTWWANVPGHMKAKEGEGHLNMDPLDENNKVLLQRGQGPQVAAFQLYHTPIQCRCVFEMRVPVGRLVGTNAGGKGNPNIIAESPLPMSVCART